ncbi:MAG: PEP-CTERM sorting domain-containing protein, partial [Candidatus Didemnitutus sp.]|nr:PEP-CTERM sorting domain-containing protein [Candidatus Didemnitutus sp.]
FAHSFGTLNITGNSTLDFSASSNSSLNIGSLTFGTVGYTLAVNGWTGAQDFFTTPTSPGTRYNPPLNQVIFAGWAGENTTWQSWDNQILPVPEPTTYGAILIGLVMGLLGYRRWRQQPPVLRPRIG